MQSEKPKELVELEDFLFELRQLMASGRHDDIAQMVQTHRDIVAQSHAYIRGLIHAL